MTIKTSKTSKSATSMAELLKKTGFKLKGFTSGEKIEAKLIEIGPKSATFNIGGKSEGVLIDKYFQEVKDYVRALSVGDKILATVIDPETKDGFVVISLRHAASDSLWNRIEKLQKDKKEIRVLVKNTNASGVLVDFEGINGFIPTSQLGKTTLEKLNELSNQYLTVKIVSIDKSKRRLVLSERMVSEAGEIELVKSIIQNIKEGEVYSGVVTTVTDFGLFVAIVVKKKKIEGLVHLSELSWEKVSKPVDVFQKGDKVKVKVIGIKDGKLALSIKHAQKDPWETISEKYKVEDNVSGKVVRISDFGAFISLESGIEGLIHITKIPPAKSLKVGDKVDCYIEEIDTKNKKISLGLVLSSKPIGYK